MNKNFVHQVGDQSTMHGQPIIKIYELDVCGFVHHNIILIEIANKMQHRIKIYYSMFIWSLACFGRHRPSSGAQNCNSSLWFCIRERLLHIEVCGRCSQAASKPVWHIPLLCVQWKTPDDGQRNCPKHVEFLSKINLRNLRNSASGWVFIRILSRWTVTWTSVSRAQRTEVV